MIRSRSPASDTYSKSHLIPESSRQEDAHYGRFHLIIYRVTSSICVTFFLVGLFICAFLRKLLFLIIPSNDSGIHAKEKEMLYSPEELKLVPDISYYFNLLNLQLNKYEIITADGFVISVHRIIDPYESIRLRQARKPVLLLHGLLQSSGSFCSSGKDSLAYMLFKAGYDVWLGNNRCGLEPRHINYSPSDYQMWNWDIIDMAKYDLTAIIDHVLANSDSKSSTLALICHSQGTTQGFITIDNDRFGNNAKISCFVALSPAVYSGSIIHDKTFIKIIAKMTLNPFFFGVWAFMPLMMTMRNLLVGSKVFGYLSYTMFNYLFDWNDSLWDRSLRDRHFLFSPVFVSVKLMSWWLNDKTGFKISKAILQDDAAWFKSDSPKIFLVVPKKDKLVDGEALISHLHNYEDPSTFSYIFLDDYSHLDVLWSETVIRDIGNPILDFLQKNEF